MKQKDPCVFMQAAKQHAKALQRDWQHMAAQLQQAEREHHAGLAALLMRVQDASTVHTRVIGRIQNDVATLTAQMAPMVALTAQRDAAQESARALQHRWEVAAAACDALRAEASSREATHAAAHEDMQRALQEAQDAVGDVQRQRDSVAQQLLDSREELETTHIALQQTQRAFEEAHRACEALQQQLAGCQARCMCEALLSLCHHVTALDGAGRWSMLLLQKQPLLPRAVRSCSRP